MKNFPRLLLVTILLLFIVVFTSNCNLLSTPTPILPTEVPTPVLVSTPVPTPRCPTSLMQVEADKVALLTPFYYNDAGKPVMGENSGITFPKGEILELCTCVQADGGSYWCELHRTIDGKIWMPGYFVPKTKMEAYP